MAEVPDTVDVALDALSSPSSDEVSAATEGFSARELAAAAAARALGGGSGGGSLPTGWTQDEFDPSSVDSHGGGLSLKEGVEATQERLDADSIGVEGSVAVHSNTGTIGFDNGAGFIGDGDGGASLSTNGGNISSFGGSIDAGDGDISTSGIISNGSFSATPTEIFVSLPTADPHSAGQLWSNSGVVKVSAG